MAYFLALETSTTACSVALAEDDELIAQREINEGYSHSENITVFIEEVLKEGGLEPSSLDAIAVSSGPGSYTGLRIGVSTAKGLCYGLDKPLIAVDTLKSMVAGFLKKKINQSASHPIYLVPMIDARRMEVYCAAYDQVLNERMPVRAEIVDQNSFADLLNSSPVYFFGDGAMKCVNVIQHQHAVFDGSFFPSAEYLIPFANEKFKQQKFEDVALFEPFYLKDFIPGIQKK